MRTYLGSACSCCSCSCIKVKSTLGLGFYFDEKQLCHHVYPSVQKAAYGGRGGLPPPKIRVPVNVPLQTPVPNRSGRLVSTID